MYRKHLLSLPLTLIIVMLFSALGPTTVYADDGVPTDTPTTEVTETDEEATEEVAADEASVNQVDETATEEPSLMEQVPDNTEVVVVNAEGEVEPLATQEAAEAVAVSDPIWCPAGVGPGGAGCTDSYSSFDDLLNFLKTNEGDPAYQQAGTIYVEMGNYGGGEASIDFNTYGFTNFDDNDLTIQGGWNTSNNTTGATTGATTTFDIPIVIGSDANLWGGSLTLRNIVVSGVVGDVGLTVYSAGNVTIEDSEFTNNDEAGVFIDAGRDVTVRRSKINDNGSNDWNVVDGRGLEIKSGGNVTLSDVEANENQIFGADITSTGAVTIANSFFSGNLMYTNGFQEFFGYGLTVVSQGDISLSGVEANENFLWGASLDGPNVFIEDSTFNRNVTDSTSFVDDTGLLIVSAGDVALDNVEANENRLMGADIQAGGQVDIANSSFSRNYGVTVDDSGNDVFWGCGLQVGGLQQTSGLRECGQQNLPASMINLDTVVADNNYFFGASLFAGSDVNISGSSFSNILYDDGTPDGFPQEQLEGLKVKSGDVISLNTVTANNNLLSGADLVANSADGFISIDESVFSNNLNGFGLSAVTGEFISLTDVTAIGNGGDGLHLVVTSPVGEIYMDNVVALNNGANGAYLETNCGRVFVTGGQYGGNAEYGLYVVNSLLTQSATFDPLNGSGSYFINQGGCVFPSPVFASPSPSDSGGTSYTVVEQTQDGLPGPLAQGNTFVSALQVTLTGQATNLAITLSFPLPAGMEDADLAVIFWNGSGWVEVPGGSVVGNEFVVTVNQTGIYVLVSK